MQLAMIWYNTFKGYLEEMSFKINSYNPCVTNMIMNKDYAVENEMENYEKRDEFKQLNDGNIKEHEQKDGNQEDENVVEETQSWGVGWKWGRDRRVEQNNYETPANLWYKGP